MSKRLDRDPALWQRVMLIAAHPDDETLAAGGLLQQARRAGAAVRILFATDGDNNPWPQRVIEHRWRIRAADRARWGRRRRGEALAALARLGISADCVRFLGSPDQGLTSLLLAGGGALLPTLTEEMTAWGPTLLITPSARDLHPDHNALAVLVRCASARLPPQQSRWTELSYLIHGHQLQLAQPPLCALPLSAAERARKREAILCHASQLVLSRRRFLAFVRESEPFVAPGQPMDYDDHHPVHAATLEGSVLRLGITPWRHWRAFGAATLSLVIDARARGRVGLCLALPGSSRPVDVRDATSGTVLTQAHFCGTRRRGEVLLPLPLLHQAERVFVKLARRWGFFDEAGWRELPCSRGTPRLSAFSVAAPRARRPKPVVCCVIPCYNIAPLCGAVVREAARYSDYVLAVDDGSTDTTGRELHTIAEESGGRIRLLSFAHNRGKGAALLAGFRYALEAWPFEVLVTLDGDGQHRPADIPRLVQHWHEERAALVIGERLHFQAMPWRSRLGNTLTRTLLRRLYPTSPSDTQSGLRALDRHFVEEVSRVVSGRRYETELQILLLALQRHKRIRTVPIPTIYLNGNRASHFQPVADSWRIYRVLLRWRAPVSPEDSCPRSPSG